jgi:ATP-dependent Clp protease ATP-binding subunit ClpA
MTSNAGTNFKGNNIGFTQEGYNALEDKVKEALKEFFRPEFLNRVDETIVFKPLTKEELHKIIDLMLKEVTDEVKEKNITVGVSEEVKDFILKIGYDEKYGARPLRRTIQKYIEDEIAESYLHKKFRQGSHVHITLNDGKIVLD